MNLVNAKRGVINHTNALNLAAEENLHGIALFYATISLKKNY